MSANPPAYTPGGALSYTITVANTGPATAGATVVDVFPAAYTGISWTCTPSGGASCPASGSGNITHSVTLPSGGLATYTVSGTIAAGTSGSISNSATAVVGAPVTDPETNNNTATLVVQVDTDRIFKDDFEP